MKVRYTSANGQLVFDVEAETAKQLFSQLGSIQDIFEAETECGCCHSSDIRFSFRVIDKFAFYELACRKCGAQFKFGQRKDGDDLFPKRKDEDGRLLANGGWSKWQPETTSQPMPGPREPERVPTGNRPINPDTPEGLQPSFDRLATLYLWKAAPTRIGPALDMLRGQLHAASGSDGTARFDKIYRAYEASIGKGTAASIKALLKDCVSALDEMSVGARPFGGQ
jgi:hypothetical protein